MFPASLLAQSKLDGIVTDKNSGQSLPGVNVLVKGTNNGVSSNFDGRFSLSKINKGDVVLFSYLGYKEYSLTYTGQQNVVVLLQEDSSKLEEVVVIGYGSVKKKDATGSVDLITSKQFNRGSVVSVDQLLVGKAPGVRITNAGGAPDSAPNIRIRGGASLSAQNSPLIVIDGVPIDTKNAAGNGNPLSLINPNDIDSFSILKDASATAIYGSRASNGVIIITTKKGTSGKPEFNFSSIVAVGSISDRINVMNANEFTNFIKQNFPTKTYLLGIDNPLTTPINDAAEDNVNTPEIEGRILSNTDWQDVIYRTSVTTDNNFSARASLLNKIPFRVSLGHTKTEGIVRTNDFERYTASLKLTPMLLNNHLKIDLNAKGLYSEKNAIDQDGAIANAINFDPTKPVYGATKNNIFNGFYQSFAYDPITQMYSNIKVGPDNPLAILEQRRRPENIRKFLGNIEFDYKMFFLSDLRAVLNLGLESSESNIQEVFGENAIQTYRTVGTGGVVNPGVNYRERQTISNQTMDAYLVYTKELTGFIKKFDVQGGYTYQNFLRDGNKLSYQYNNATGLREVVKPTVPFERYYENLNMQSFFGRTNIDLAGKYLFTASFRADASSYFRNEGNVWGYFPSAAFAWKIKEESFLKESGFVSDLKLRIGWGKTGQQDISSIDGLNYYPSIPLFVVGNVNSQYLPGQINYSALPFNKELTWEKTTTYNIGLDFELFKNRLISGSIDVFKNKTTDLLAKVPLPTGQGLTNDFIRNVGVMEGRGIETSLNIRPIQSENWNVEFNGNVAYSYNEITDLGPGVKGFVDNSSSIPNGTGTKLAENAVGFQPYSAHVFQQIYDATGNPIEGAYVDRNGDNAITNEDRYYEAIRPNWTLGFGTSVNYKNFDLNASFRGQVGGLMYNTRDMVAGNTQQAIPTSNDHLTNVLSGPKLFNDNIGNVPLSDHFLEDASFIRCEALSLGYKANNMIKNGSVRFYVAANNLFLITKYSGQDPENFGGIDDKFYPRPKVYSFGLNVNF